MAVIDAFRESALPRLREAARVQALFVVLDIAGADEARSEVSALASTLGANLLQRKDQDRLFDTWIPEALWAELEKALDRVVAIEQRMEVAIEDNPWRFYEGFAARCVDPERMRWTFAAISKPYRQHLIRERSRAGKA